MKNFFSGIPRPILKRAEQFLHEALDEQEKSPSQVDAVKKKVSPCQFVRTLERECISLSEIINWAKSHYPENSDASFIIMKDTSDNLDFDFLLYLFFSKENKPLLGEQFSSLKIYAKKLDDKLLETFDNNDIIEFE